LRWDNINDVHEVFMANLYLIVGLGNPGKQYASTRHNVGWMVLDELARRHNLSFDKTEKKALTASGFIGGRKVLLARPQTYMNLSGEAVRGLLDFYKIDLPNLLVISDDLDIPLGTLRLRQSGSAGGQGGLKNVIQHLGTNEFNRVRFGIGRPPGKMNPKDYVLQEFKGDEAILAREVVDQAANAVEVWLQEGIHAAMTQFNGDVQKRQPEPQRDPQEDLALFMRAHELNRTDPGPIDKIISVLKRMGRSDKAADWHLKAADLLDAQGKTGLAISQRERAASLKPELIDVHRQIADAYMQTGNPKKAVQRLLILAEYLESRGRLDEARAAVQDALAINPQHPKALEVQDKLRERA
jgi:PTH1 family peptidyl-tRNA hydrolase